MFTVEVLHALFFSPLAFFFAFYDILSYFLELTVTGDKDIGIGMMQWRLDTLGRHWINR